MATSPSLSTRRTLPSRWTAVLMYGPKLPESTAQVLAHPSALNAQMIISGDESNAISVRLLHIATGCPLISMGYTALFWNGSLKMSIAR
ncbi:hypothetical protein TPAR_01711 [Tolypocladium paradoxum]|uniref:Uncharacterized protein n=1 Tax=Tolypocladium paradoxum TaxID=94208 RepID=A0A2S4L6R3_9HYPO|nr:hypothetical protein TPAR_01711 [Tolypocladium paradoxum]